MGYKSFPVHHRRLVLAAWDRMEADGEFTAMGI